MPFKSIFWVVRKVWDYVNLKCARSLDVRELVLGDLEYIVYQRRACLWWLYDSALLILSKVIDFF